MMLPSYTIRESRRAKHVSLKISPVGKLEVVIPPGFDQTRIPDIVKRKQNWINRITQRIETQQSLEALESSNGLPHRMTLQAIAEEWQIGYQQTPMPGVRLIERSRSELAIFGQVDHQVAGRGVLQHWLAYKARLHLLPWLRSVSQEIQLPYKSASIRQQKTRWGSCSSKKTISLNSKLLFLPAPLVRYVFVHELCHTIHMNHSATFWKLVQSHEPDYEQLDRQLNDARAWVPLWLEFE
jgi:predicted metal-dependent hydrolase